MRLAKSMFGAVLFAGLAAAVAAPAQPASAAPFARYHGHWVHGWHDGRFGWWWTGPGFWYWYTAPYYDAYGPPPPGDAAPASWYYCDSAKAYYPYVGSCASGWRAVPAAPQGEAANTPPAPPPPGAASAPAAGTQAMSKP